MSVCSQHNREIKEISGGGHLSASSSLVHMSSCAIHQLRENNLRYIVKGVIRILQINGSETL